MDMMGGKLPTSLQLRILSLLPAKDVVTTMVLSKRWHYHWMMVPKLVYDDSYQNPEYGRFSRFVDRSLVLHEAPVIETLHFKLGKTCGTGDIRVWIKAADKRSVRELIIEIETSSNSKTPVTLPTSLYTCCQMLVILKLSNAVLEFTSSISFPSLKTLSLISVKYPGDEFVNRLVSSCPVLEDLVVVKYPDDNVYVLSVKVPSLKSLVLHKKVNSFEHQIHGFVIDAPSLESLDIVDYTHGFCVIENNISKIFKANVDSCCLHTEQFLGSITSVKRLYLCLSTSKGWEVKRTHNFRVGKGHQNQVFVIQLFSGTEFLWNLKALDMESADHMDSISQLPEALHMRILSFLPAKDVVATMVLSKRWQFLWMSVSKLVFDDSYQNIRYERFSRFVDRYLLLHEAPVVETLHFKLGQYSGAVDVRVWTRTAVKRCVREMIMEMDCSSSTIPVILPRILYTGCTVLVTLKLNSIILVDVSSLVSFPSLKTFSLLSVEYPDDEFVKRLLNNCPVLEGLVVERKGHDNVTIFNIIVPSLKSLFLRESTLSVIDNARGFVIDASSLEYFAIVDYYGGFCVFENNTPKIVKADVDVTYSHPGKILSSFTSVKRLYLCLRTTKDVYPVGSIFCCLKFLEICTCETEWLNLLVCLLNDSPKLRALKLVHNHKPRDGYPRPCWIEPSSVPECLLSSLETLEWVMYEGREEDKEVAAFILRSGCCLKKVTISSNSIDPIKNLEMLKELSSSPRRSPTCQLIFD